MNGEQLLERVKATISDPAISDDDIMFALNLGQMNIADRLMLPDLADGSATLTATTTDYSVDLPEDFHNKPLIYCHINGEAVNVYRDLKSLESAMGGLRTDQQINIRGVAAGHGASGTAKLYYQPVPMQDTELDIRYYRKPTEITDDESSYPDGFRNNVNFPLAILWFACWYLYQTHIERGIEGTPNSDKFHALYQEAVAELELDTYRTGKMYHHAPPVNKLHWP